MAILCHKRCEQAGKRRRNDAGACTIGDCQHAGSGASQSADWMEELTLALIPWGNMKRTADRKRGEKKR